MPELPEVERARALIERAALGREIVRVDDSRRRTSAGRTLPGDIARGPARVGRLTARPPPRQGDVGGDLRPRRRGRAGGRPRSGPCTSGMAGPDRRSARSPAGDPEEGGSGRPPRPAPRAATRLWRRFTLEFADGGSLVLFDKRRLGRAVLNPGPRPVWAPTRWRSPPRQFRRARRPRPGAAEGADHGSGGARRRREPARRRDAVAGASCRRCAPPAIAEPRGARPTCAPSCARLHARRDRQGRRAHRQGSCRSAGARRRTARAAAREMVRATVGGRTTWWCSAEQAWPPSLERLRAPSTHGGAVAAIASSSAMSARSFGPPGGALHRDEVRDRGHEDLRTLRCRSETSTASAAPRTCRDQLTRAGGAKHVERAGVRPPGVEDVRTRRRVGAHAEVSKGIWLVGHVRAVAASSATSARARASRGSRCRRRR